MSFYTDYLRRLNGGNLKMTTDFCDHDVLVFDFEEGVKKKQLSDARGRLHSGEWRQ